MLMRAQKQEAVLSGACAVRPRVASHRGYLTHCQDTILADAGKNQICSQDTRPKAKKGDLLDLTYRINCRVVLW